MSDVNKGIQRAFILWLSGASLVDIYALPEVKNLIEQGVVVELDPSPITGPRAQHYQVFSGQLPARFGFFDTLIPLCRLARPQQGVDGYTIVEESNGRDVAPKMLPELLRDAGWVVEYEEVSPAQLPDYIEGLLGSETNEVTCKIAKCSLGAAFSAHTSTLTDILHASGSWVGETGLLAVLSDIQSAKVERLVNVNNFLAEMGVIERDEQNGQINWSNTLAYFAGHGQLWINLFGRDPQGAVHPQDEYEEVCDTLVKALPTKLRDPQTGTQVIERVYRKEELYSSEYLFCAPDLVVVFKPGYVPSTQSTHLGFDDGIFMAADGLPVYAGAHPSMLGGFLIASAPVFNSGLSVQEHGPLTAVVPTLLHALGVKYSGLDGSPLSTLFAPSYLETHPIPTDIRDHELSEEDEELVISRLRDLGYI